MFNLGTAASHEAPGCSVELSGALASGLSGLTRQHVEIATRRRRMVTQSREGILPEARF